MYLFLTILRNFKENIKYTVFPFLTLLLVYQVKGISSLPVMGADGSLLLDFAGTARKVQIMTCARSATCRIALITGARLNALTRVGAKGEFSTKE